MKKEAQSMESLLSYILLIGVSLSALLIFLGIILVHIHPPQQFPGFVATLREGLRWDGYSLLVLGFLLLLATPIMRVVFSFVLFLLAKDWTYTLLTLLVLLILIASIILGALSGKAFVP